MTIDSQKFFHSSLYENNNFKRPIFAVKYSVVKALLDRFGDVISDAEEIDLIVKTIVNNIEIKERTQVEDIDSNYIHPISYCPIIKDGKDCLDMFVYQRGKGIGESRLVGNYSVGIGGHVDINNEDRSKLIDPSLLYQKQYHRLAQYIVGGTLYREFVEEISQLNYLAGRTEEDALELVQKHPFAMSVFSSAGITKPDLIIFDKSNQVGKVHIGFITAIPFEQDIVDSGPIEMQEDELTEVGFLPVKEALALPNMENWSSITLKAFNEFEEAGYPFVLRENIAIRFKIAQRVRERVHIGTNCPSTGLNANIDFNMT